MGKRYITTADTNKLIRAELKKAFPNVKFKVTMNSGGSSTGIGWVDGPTADQVKDAVCRFESAHFDGMFDLETTITQTDDEGNDVVYGTKYIFPNRRYSVPFLLNVMYDLFTEWGWTDVQVGASDGYFGARPYGKDVDKYPANGDGRYTYGNMIMQAAADTAE
jgi:hypothetical protein